MNTGATAYWIGISCCGKGYNIWQGYDDLGECGLTIIGFIYLDHLIVRVNTKCKINIAFRRIVVKSILEGGIQ